jgi:hypothetical protein
MFPKSQQAVSAASIQISTQLAEKLSKLKYAFSQELIMVLCSMEVFINMSCDKMEAARRKS